ncbi:MAG TPA: energy-coupling factor transporter transmembrane protein EcfT [Firmicutes bacterium]|nr:energy-coupling factor transporter transmembrane protein EcfT [Bacillota bacterium]
MIRDITIGQYYAADSVIHRLDPRLKLVVAVAYIVMLFLIEGPVAYATALAALAVVIALSRVPVKFMLRGIQSIFLLIVLTGIINIFTNKTGTVLWGQGWYAITSGGLLFAAHIVLRLMMLILTSSLLTLTTTPIRLTDGIEYLLAPFGRVGVPYHEIAMMMTIALRFIPTLLDETDKIMKAQQARGADFESGNLMQKAKSLVPVLVPLFLSAFRRAEELATAMEARCYRGGEFRTKMNRMVFERRDYIAVVVMVVFLALEVILCIIG